MRPDYKTAVLAPIGPADNFWPCALRSDVAEDLASARATAERAAVPGRKLQQATGPPAGSISRIDAECGCRWLTEVPTCDV